MSRPAPEPGPGTMVQSRVSHRHQGAQAGVPSPMASVFPIPTFPIPRVQDKINAVRAGGRAPGPIPGPERGRAMRGAPLDSTRPGLLMRPLLFLAEGGDSKVAVLLAGRAKVLALPGRVAGVCPAMPNLPCQHPPWCCRGAGALSGG